MRASKNEVEEVASLSAATLSSNEVEAGGATIVGAIEVIITPEVHTGEEGKPEGGGGSMEETLAGEGRAMGGSSYTFRGKGQEGGESKCGGGSRGLTLTGGTWLETLAIDGS
ncbi:hypothetical protein Salat_1903000 [Sesamum alatum]|uniref:Uncharacterized protein n=1 Tax=Sesamum alatum TaxID=300844 RepID=A0AAE1Y482_9LAMI|nr:hypothetical protein Salat_1903000 [Sesamum alatum]